MTGWGSKFDLQLLSQCGSTYYCLRRSIPEIHQIVAGTLSNQQSFVLSLLGVRLYYPGLKKKTLVQKWTCRTNLHTCYQDRKATTIISIIIIIIATATSTTITADCKALLSPDRRMRCPRGDKQANRGSCRGDLPLSAKQLASWHTCHIFWRSTVTVRILSLVAKCISETDLLRSLCVLPH